MNDEESRRSLARAAIARVWPSVEINDANIDAQVAGYVFLVFAEAREGDRAVRTLSPLYVLPTSWTAIPTSLVRAVFGYVRDTNADAWGLGVRSAVSLHARPIQAALKYGTDVYPLEFPLRQKKSFFESFFH